MNPGYVLATASLLLLAPTAYGCVNFLASLEQDDGLNFNFLDGQLWDEGQEVCAMFGKGDDNGVFIFTCVDPSFQTSFDSSSFVVNYSNDGGSYSFLASYDGAVWTSCQYGCDGNQCFV
ncbi:unnamed protein product [Calypogeia fissa]